MTKIICIGGGNHLSYTSDKLLFVINIISQLDLDIVSKHLCLLLDILFSPVQKQ